MKYDFAALRFPGETELMRILEEDYALASYYDIFDNKDELENVTNTMLTNTVRLNKIIAPRLYNLCSEVQETLGFEAPIDFYLFASTEVNAFSVNGFGIVPHIICFTSSLVQQLNDSELRFVIGHEIGHLIYQHSRLDVVNKLLMNRESEQIPASLAIYFLRWQRFAEISSDRIGYLCMPDIKVIGTVFFKFASGLSETYLNFDIDEYLKQLVKIKEIAVGDFYSTHPNNLVRIQNLLNFANSRIMPGNKDPKAMSADTLEEKMMEMMNLVEVHPKKEKDKQIVEFISTVGTFLSSSEGEMTEREWITLYDWLSEFTTQPETYLEFNDMAELTRRMKAVCKYFANTGDGEKFELIEKMAQLALLDGRLEPKEKERIYEIGKLLKISADEVTHIIRLNSEAFLSPTRRMLIKKMK